MGEIIALAALIVSALGVWIAWKSNSEDKPTRVVEQRQPVPLTLRGTADRAGGELDISPVDSGHALQSLTVTIQGASAIEVGSDGKLQASDVQAALKDRSKEDKDRTYSVPVRIERALCRDGRRPPRRRNLCAALSVGRRGPVRRPLGPPRRPQPLAGTLDSSRRMCGSGRHARPSPHRHDIGSDRASRRARPGDASAAPRTGLEAGVGGHHLGRADCRADRLSASRRNPDQQRSPQERARH